MQQKSKSKKVASNKPTVPHQVPQVIPQQVPQMTNAQQQQQQQAPQMNAFSLFNQPQMPIVQQQQFTNAQQAQQINSSNSLFGSPQMSNAQQQQQFSNVFPIQQQAMQHPVQQQSTVGYYGNAMRRGGAVSVPMPQIFNDDEPLQPESVKEIGKEGKVDIEIKAQRSQVKLGQVTVLPAMCSIISSGGARTAVDLICVIDVSGSMDGQKINLVKETMRFLIETLTPADRLSIITFNGSGNRICGLKTVTQQNMVGFSNNINGLFASGGTQIMSGLELALKTIRDRKVPNKVTSIFLLSDGQDKGAEEQLKAALKSQQNSQLGVFSIHSFGFGTDHDEDLMNKICLLKDGSFYFIKQLSTLDEAFCNALGGIISLVASEVVITLKNVSKDLVQGIVISKFFGQKYQKLNEKEYRIKITQLMTEISKDFVFELTIPAISGEVGDIGREHIVIDCSFQGKGVQGQVLNGKATLTLTLINPHEEIAEANENVDVIENYLRVKAAEAIEENMKKAENNNYEGAQQGIDQMIQVIQGSKRARKQKMQPLVNDLQLIRQKCSKQEYQQEGRKWMVNAQNAHSNKANYQYSNCMQTEMVNQRKAKKSGY